MNKDKGFTMIELLIVLFVVSIVTTITAVTILPTYRNKQVDHFFEQFSKDILYAQTYAMSHKRQIYVYFDNANSQYIIHEGGLGSTVLRRKYEKHILLKNATLASPLTFFSNGNINKGGTLYVYIYDDIFVITFQLGKGRFHVKKL